MAHDSSLLARLAPVATYDSQACQALEDHGDVRELERAEAAGELEDTAPWEQVRKELRLGD